MLWVVPRRRGVGARGIPVDPWGLWCANAWSPSVVVCRWVGAARGDDIAFAVFVQVVCVGLNTVNTVITCVICHTNIKIICAIFFSRGGIFTLHERGDTPPIVGGGARQVGRSGPSDTVWQLE